MEIKGKQRHKIINLPYFKKKQNKTKQTNKQTKSWALIKDKAWWEKASMNRNAFSSWKKQIKTGSCLHPDKNFICFMP